MSREELIAYLDGLLQPARFRDYCPNGLQVEGRARIEKLVCGVTASQALLDAAVATDADAVLVHHGYLWRSDDPRITGMRKTRLATLLCHDINLLAYHLPLDAHPDLGNNAQLARRLDWEVDGRFGEQDIGFLGRPRGDSCLGAIVSRLELMLQRRVLCIGNGDRKVERIAWCTGAAQSYFEQAIAAGADLFVSGEVSEPTYHLACESGVAYIAAGHHATERYGVQALAENLGQTMGIECRYVEIDNPV